MNILLFIKFNLYDSYKVW